MLSPYIFCILSQLLFFILSQFIFCMAHLVFCVHCPYSNFVYCPKIFYICMHVNIVKPQILCMNIVWYRYPIFGKYLAYLIDHILELCFRRILTDWSGIKISLTSFIVYWQTKRICQIWIKGNFDRWWIPTDWLVDCYMQIPSEIYAWKCLVKKNKKNFPFILQKSEV